MANSCLALIGEREALLLIISSHVLHELVQSSYILHQILVQFSYTLRTFLINSSYPPRRLRVNSSSTLVGLNDHDLSAISASSNRALMYSVNRKTSLTIILYAFSFVLCKEIVPWTLSLKKDVSSAYHSLHDIRPSDTTLVQQASLGIDS
jgi:hypothetical protein